VNSAAIAVFSIRLPAMYRSRKRANSSSRVAIVSFFAMPVPAAADPPLGNISNEATTSSSATNQARQCGGQLNRRHAPAVILSLTHICVVDADGKRLWRGKCATDPIILAETIRTQAGSDARVGIETGPLTPWLVHVLRGADVDMICIEARHAHAVMAAAQVNKNDQHRAEG
jgi:hypothetical protein